jgi:O-acetyl-ADP-ribose deacetylase (regulator of RNase III)
MPYGKKPDADGAIVNFDQIYKDLIQGALATVDGVECHRADDLNKSGWIHEHMLRHIVEDPIAIVDTSTLNANVFYELGVRHALRRSITVLIHRKGTTWPFNIAGMSSIEYGTSDAALKQARRKLREFITNGLQDPDYVDSLVHRAVPGLRVEHSQPRRLTKVETFEFPLVRRPDTRIGLIAGEPAQIRSVDVWVNSENTEMQMDRYYGTSTSATIRYLGAQKHPATGRVVEDTIGKAVAEQMGSERQVDPAAVIATGPGALARNNVKLLLHVASVIGQPREGYKPIERIERCVTHALARVDGEFRDQNLKSIMFPLLGTGPAGGDLAAHAERLIRTAVEYLEANPDTTFRVVYFYVWSDVALDVCRRIIAQRPELASDVAGAV